MRYYWTVALSLMFPAIAAAQQNVSLRLDPERLPTAGEPIRVVAQLTREGKPLEADDLKIVHTQKFHLLVVDSALKDYQHIHPQPTATPGSYLFTFTPKSSEGYCAWADVTPVGGTQTFAPATIGTPSKAAIEAANVFSTEVDNYHFNLSFDTPPKAGQASMGTIEVTDKTGAPVLALEPVMGAFAHIVALYPNCGGVIHTHPMGEEPKTDDARGGPTLTFHLAADKPGYIRLFAQVKINGTEIFAPFSVIVSQ